MQAPADWYPDPTDRHELRYWDGERWTEHVFSGGVQGVDALAPPLPVRMRGSGLVLPSDLHDEQVTKSQPVDYFTPRSEPVTPPSVAEEVVGEEVVAEPVEDDAVDENPVAPGTRESGTSDDSPADAPAIVDDGDLDESDAEVFEERVDAVVTAFPSVPAVEPVSSWAVPGDVFVMPVSTVHDLASRARKASALAAVPESEIAPEEVGADQSHDPAAIEEAAGQPTDDEVHEGETASGAPPIDAPPPAVVPPAVVPPAVVPGAVAAPAPSIRGAVLGDDVAERSDVSVDHETVLRCRVAAGRPVIGRVGTLIATQGAITLEDPSPSHRRARRRPGVEAPFRRATGQGEVLHADEAQHVTILELTGVATVRTAHILAFSDALGWTTGSLTDEAPTVRLEGNGWLAVVSDGAPVVLRTSDAPASVRVGALLAWSDAATPRTDGIGLGAGTSVTFDGAGGLVLIQPASDDSPG